VVCVDTDEAIKKTKGKDRPVNSQGRRLKALSVINELSYLVPLTCEAEFNSDEFEIYYEHVLETVSPDYVVTHKIADPSWKKKKKMIEKLGGKILLDLSERPTSTTAIISGIS